MACQAGGDEERVEERERERERESENEARCEVFSYDGDEVRLGWIGLR